LVVTSIDESPAIVRNRTKSSNNWIGFDLRCPSLANGLCIGARVSLKSGPTVQVREVRSGGSYLSQSDLRVHFGLHSHRAPVDIEVRLPGGRVQRVNGLRPGAYHVVTLE